MVAPAVTKTKLELALPIMHRVGDWLGLHVAIRGGDDAMRCRHVNGLAVTEPLDLDLALADMQRGKVKPCLDLKLRSQNLQEG